MNNLSPCCRDISPSMFARGLIFSEALRLSSALLIKKTFDSRMVKRRRFLPFFLIDVHVTVA